MKTILFSVSFLLAVVRVRSTLEPNTDYFVMTEAHITEYRSKEDANAGYLPFYVECITPVTKFNCQPAIPKMNSKEGYVTMDNNVSPNIPTKKIYYGCPLEIELGNVLDLDDHFKKSLLMREVGEKDNALLVPPRWYNIYKYRCKSDVSPTIWRMGPDQGTKLLYKIGFQVPGLQEMPLAEIYYDYEKKIPIWTKHTLYGISLAAPTAAFQTIEEIEYQTDSQNYSKLDLKIILETYDEFNEKSQSGVIYEVRRLLNETLKDYRLPALSDENRIVKGHLIPEYDMIMSNWKKIPRFAQTIVPTWEELYLNEWIDVEEMIRDKSFREEINLTVFSGTYGQLTFNVPTQKEDEQRPGFYLGTQRIVFPEMIWKLVIDETSLTNRATVIIFPNITEKLVASGIFTQFEQPCRRICKKFSRITPTDPNKPIYCCRVIEVINKIHELSTKVDIRKKFDILFT